MKMKIIFILSLLFVTLNGATIETDKELYDYGNGDKIIHVSFGDMQGTSQDWIGIYPAGASYEFENVVAWKWTGGLISGTLDFNLLSAGNYDVRAFYNNSLTKKAESTFSIIGQAPVVPDVNLTTNKSTYLNTETITATFKYMQGNATDWIGIYPAGASYEFENVVAYKQTGGDINGSVTFTDIAGNYDVRAFYNNSLTKKAESTFSIIGQPPVIPDVNLTTNKSTYLNTETIIATFQNMQGNTTDWIGIYPAGASYEFENVVAYKQTGGDINGSVTFTDIPVGNYDVRAFFNNTLAKEATTTISVIADPNYHDVNLTLNKTVYAQNELIYVNYNYMEGNPTDWIGIYPAGASYEFSNVIDMKYTGGKVQGEVALGGFPANKPLHGFTPMPGLAPGNYEIRAFFNNTLHTEKVVSFTVVDTPVVSTMYEDANGSISPNWIHILGPYPPVYYNGVVRLRAKWVAGPINLSEYSLPFDTPNTTQKVLELDVGGVGRWTPHFYVGVSVQTINGQRNMLWDSFLNHYNVSANKQGDKLSYPTYVELQRNTANSRKHFRVNLDKYLKILEPDNRVLSVTSFFATGGDLDNIKLSSH
ncbi:no hits [hydrothermal vent metagenome]|uniref:No hits n=1 Tax=hydrothermal vent metagenome TaxID=652676 RepID=A0A1W1BFY5_9ZZZZ